MSNLVYNMINHTNSDEFVIIMEGYCYGFEMSPIDCLISFKGGENSSNTLKIFIPTIKTYVNGVLQDIKISKA